MPEFLLSLLWGSLSIIGSIAIISLIIILHELGHYTCAMQVGIKAEAVCVGFGRLLKEYIDQNKTKWQIRLWPIGGYVDLCSNKKRKINQYLKLTYRKKVWIMLGGIIVNTLLAILLFWACNVTGYEYSITQVGKIYPQSLAQISGMKSGDRIIKINQSQVITWRDVALPIIMAKTTGGSIDITVKRKGLIENLTPISGSKIQFLENKGVLRSYGMSPAIEKWPAIIRHIEIDSPASKAGLRTGDEITQINGHPIQYAYEFINYVKKNPESKVNITVKRKQQLLKKQLNISSQGFIKKTGYIGVKIADAQKDPRLYSFINYNPITGLVVAVTEALQYILIQAATLYLLVSGTLSIQTLGGPVVILAQTASILSIQNLVMLLHWTAVVNISLAFINILPIPVFDGGRIMILTLEAIKGSKLSWSTQERIDRYTFALLLGLCAMITYNDIARILG